MEKQIDLEEAIAAAVSPPLAADKGDFENPTRWFWATQEEAEWWHGGFATRDEAIIAGHASAGGGFWIAEARRMVPGFAIFDADEICERINEDECWWEDGWEGQPDPSANAELEAELAAVLRRWVVKHGNLDGACLDEVRSEYIEPESSNG